MGLFGRGKRSARKEEAAVARPVMVQDRTYDDPVLDAAVAEVDAGGLQAGLTVLAETHDDPEVRTQRVAVLGKTVIGHSDELAAIAEEADNPDLWLLVGEARIQEAWAIRGSGSGASVGKDRAKVFHATLRRAVEPLHRAAKLLPQDAAPWVSLMPVARGLNVDREQNDDLWRKVMERAPMLYPAHWHRLQYLAAKWGGSEEEMLSFAHGCVDKADPGDPLVAMLPLAHFETYLPRYRRLVEQRSPMKIATLQVRHFTAVADELARAADHWQDEPRKHPRDLEAHNLFAGAFCMAMDPARTRTHLAAMGDRLHGIPWAYLGLDPLDEFHQRTAKYR
ncbi:hypothetical protein JOF53_001558 [Crossiella equi]|uniref:DUF4034 domain-containing protein n=1 Tax=Crossiella equi TaxID=130796 RepID=A0ABS5A8Q2_9PSEU|nr:hypothetical protein [Crossiella equi]MBP2472686.1 hypothetical protein [Crossiella equi]